MINSENNLEKQVKIASLIAYGVFVIAIVAISFYFFFLNPLTNH